MFYRGLVQRILQCSGMPLGKIDTIIVLLIKNIVLYTGFQAPKSIPQRKLIQRVILKLRHKGTVQQFFSR